MLCSSETCNTWFWGSEIGKFSVEPGAWHRSTASSYRLSDSPAAEYHTRLRGCVQCTWVHFALWALHVEKRQGQETPQVPYSGRVLLHFILFDWHLKTNIVFICGKVALMIWPSCPKSVSVCQTEDSCGLSLGVLLVMKMPVNEREGIF